ncbi:MAG: beta-lactamase family protein [Oscillospiraceae bacterium]|jgi:CubicO group peptidase (beta-lactamase class C family)|nr:beta-lactamase family protein [Oscillospiraceae bacterium]
MMNYEQIWNDWADSAQFSGVFSVSDENGIIFEKCCGCRNRSEKLSNNKNTAFSIASGTKLFTGLAVCKLIDENKLTLDVHLCEILPYDLGQIDKSVTIYQLLTHTSGVGDYIDEESENCIEQLHSLYNKYPSYLWERLEYYLQMITPLPPKFEPGTRYAYSNSGFILLGLVIEAVSGVSYQQFVTDNIIKPLELAHTGFYRMDSLPENTALGYMRNGRSNIFNLPVIGGSDGGLFTCSSDLDILWRVLFSNKILSENMFENFLKQQSVINETESYGLGIYRYNLNDKLFYYAVGGDFGVDFFTAYLPKQKVVISALGNTEVNTYPLMEAIISSL